MFGLRLKSWMEAHLGRPRHKSTTHQNQKRASKDSSSSTASTTTNNTTSTNTTTTTTTTTSSTTTTTSIATLSSNSTTTTTNTPVRLQPHSHSVESHPPKNSNFDPSTDFSSSTATTNATSSLGVHQINSVTIAAQQHHYQHHQNQQLEQQQQQPPDSQEEEHHHHQQPSTSSVTASTSNSNSILLGSFSNNLSSPDTGYSTDGYSPKSVYPALSFESSGKSTPKSSYTISSLVSSELLNKNTPSPSQSQSNSVQNGLELDECASPPPPPPCNIDSSSDPNGDTAMQFRQLHCSINNNPNNSNNTNSHHSHSVVACNEIVNQVVVVVQNDRKNNYILSSTQTMGDVSNLYSKVSAAVSASTSSCPPSQSQNILIQQTPNAVSITSAAAANDASNINISSCSNSSMNRPQPLVALPSIKNCSDESSLRIIMMNESLSLLSCSGGSCGCSSGGCGCGSQGENANAKNSCNHTTHKNHRRTESMDEQQSRKLANSSCVVTGSGRNIRTSLVLTSSSQIPECNPGLKNAFSLCSPRRERTRIKTNPWITISHHNDSNTNANNNSSGEQGCHSFTTVTSSNSDTESGSGSGSGGAVSVSGIGVSSDSTCNNHTGVSGDPTQTFLEINNRPGGRAGGGGGTDLESSLLYRISTSTSASDSGKGTLEPGTNRNSTESSCLLSDSTSTRNSIISHENGSIGSPIANNAKSNSNSNTLLIGHGHGLQCSDDTELQAQCAGSTTTTTTTTNISSVKSTPKCGSVRRLNNSSNSEPKSEDGTSTTTFAELIGKYDESSYHTMVDKETDILSDWANTDEDGEDEIETDQNDNDTVTPTPSSPDTDTGARVLFTNSHSNSSATDLDFIDSLSHSARAAASAHRRYTQNINNHSNSVSGSVAVPIQSPYHHNMNLPTTCYQPLPMIPIQNPMPISISIPIHPPGIPDAYDHDAENVLNQSQLMANHVLSPPIDAPNTITTARCFNTRITNVNGAVSVPTHSSKSSSGNGNNLSSSNSSHAIARGALGFLRKIFKKGSCSSQRTSPGSGKVKMSRSRGMDNNNVAAGLRSPLLAADSVSNPNYPLSNIKPLSPAINGYFLTPTPNSFRRRSGTGTDSSDSKSSKQHKGFKTDIIRLAGPPLPPLPQSSIQQIQIQLPYGQQQQSFSSSSSSSNANPNGSNTNGNGASSFLTPNFQPGTNTNLSNTNTSSTTASSAHSMSTSTSLSGGDGNQTQSQSQARVNPYSNSNQNSRQSPFMSNQRNNRSTMSPMLIPHGNENASTKLIPATTVTSQSQRQHQQNTREILPPPKVVSSGPCPYESPRLQNATSSRINSPSFNNYSPIHRLVVTGGNHLLNRAANPTSSSNAAPGTLSSFYTESPLLIPRSGNIPLPTSNTQAHSNNNPTFPPNSQIINRPVPNTCSPLINHRHSISSPHPPHPYAHPGAGGAVVVGPFASPSPILRNPRYQYITSSNQNSPVLNVPKRINIPPHHSHSQAPPHPHPHGNPNGHAGGGSAMISTFSPVPSPRQNGTHSFSTHGSPNLNTTDHHHHQHPLHRNRSGSLGFDYDNVPCSSNTNTNGTGGNGNIPASSLHNSVLHQSPSFQNHYYSSPVVQPRSSHQNQSQNPPRSFLQSSGGVGICPGNASPRTHNAQRYQNNFTKFTRYGNGNLTNNNGYPFPISSSPLQERIYETVDSDDDDGADADNSDEGDGNGGDFEFDIPVQFSREETRRDNEDDKCDGYIGGGGRSRDSGSRYTPKACRSSSIKPKSKSTSKSKRSKKSSSLGMAVGMGRPAPSASPAPPRMTLPLPMMLGTYLSETETRLLEADSVTDRKYKRLITEAEALLKEISIEKSKPWVGRRDSLRSEDCPQSDPLRRKAYDCWALRRLQQELAGCCASPPVLHRSRLNITSPSTPSASSHPYQNHNLSLVQVHSDVEFMNHLMSDRNRNHTPF